MFNDLNDLMNSLKSLESEESEQLGPKVASEKLCQYTQPKKQPAINLLRDIRTFDPIQLSSLTVDYNTIKENLLLPDTCDEEWPIYVGLAKDASPSNILQFWTSVRNRVPHLAAAAILRLQMPVNSADVERSFSCLRNIDTCRRQNLKDDNLKNMLKISFNSL